MLRLAASTVRAMWFRGGIRRCFSGPSIRQCRTDETCSTVSVTFEDGAQHAYPSIWLRDHCECETCVDPASGQKLHRSGAVWDTFQGIERVDSSSHSLGVVWKYDGHKSVFASSTLHDWRQRGVTSSLVDRRRRIPRRRDVSSDPRCSTPRLWLGEEVSHAPIDIDFECYMRADDVDFRKIALSALYQYGLLFIRRVPDGDLDMVERLARRIGPPMETLYGVVWDVRDVPNAANIAYTSIPLDYHQDLMYFETPPGLQFLHCIERRAIGGLNYFADGFRVAADFRKAHPRAFHSLTDCPVTFQYRRGGHHYEFHRPTFSSATLNRFAEISYAPPFQGPLVHLATTDHVDRFYRDFARFERHLRQDIYRYTRQLNAGDCVVFDNRRVLHARTAFDTRTGGRHLRGTYVLMDVFWDAYRRHQPGPRDFSITSNSPSSDSSRSDGL